MNTHSYAEKSTELERPSHAIQELQTHFSQLYARQAALERILLAETSLKSKADALDMRQDKNVASTGLRRIAAYLLLFYAVFCLTSLCIRAFKQEKASAKVTNELLVQLTRVVIEVQKKLENDKHI